jgi:hypothetical protein
MSWSLGLKLKHGWESVSTFHTRQYAQQANIRGNFCCHEPNIWFGALVTASEGRKVGLSNYRVCLYCIERK